MTYLITFACYGCHLHGHSFGSVDRQHKIPGSPMIHADPERVCNERQHMEQLPYQMDARRRDVVLAALEERCREQNWTLLAAHVRTSHVHLVVAGEVRPERIMNDVKAYASRCLNRRTWDEPGRKRWARHGSTRWLWDTESVAAAVRYVVDGQGDPMALFEMRLG